MRCVTTLSFLIVLVAGCESYHGRPSSYEGSFGVTYRETTHAGRIYVIGKSAT